MCTVGNKIHGVIYSMIKNIKELFSNSTVTLSIYSILVIIIFLLGNRLKIRGGILKWVKH